MEPVYFVAYHLRRRWPELDHLNAVLDMAAVPRSRWAPLENIWIVSTYLRLKARGYPVRIVDRPVPDAINICCDEALVHEPDSEKAFCVITQGDRWNVGWGEYGFVQSPEQLGGRHVSLIRHWPQPGLIGRDAGRRTRVGRVGYVGPRENLAAAFQTEAFAQSLTEMSIEFVIRDDPAQWHDFSDLDVYLAVRDWPRHLIRTKPATKLVHAWLTGVPALLGPEPAFQYWGERGEDYFEVQTPEEAVAAIRRLKDDPQLYEAVRQRGFVKSGDHDEEAVCRQWMELLSGPVTEAFEQWRQAGRATWAMRAIKRRLQRVQARVNHRVFQTRAKGWRGIKRGITRRLGMEITS